MINPDGEACARRGSTCGSTVISTLAALHRRSPAPERIASPLPVVAFRGLRQLAIGRRLDLEAAIAGPAAEGGK